MVLMNFKFISMSLSLLFRGLVCPIFCLQSATPSVDPLKLSGLLENDNIVVSRRANSYVLTSVGAAGAGVKKKLHNVKQRANGLETMLKKAGAGKHRTPFETDRSPTNK